MRPVLYVPDEAAFKYNGVGVLSDSLSCDVTQEKNGIYTLDMEYPTAGIWAEYLLPNYIIKAQAHDSDDVQLFRIQRAITTNKGTKQVEANHISYDLIGRPVGAYTASGVASAVAGINANAVIPTGFTFTTNMTSNVQYSILTPRSAKAVLGGQEGSLIDVYGGELKYDNFNVALLDQLGSDRGVQVRYGKNLINLKQELDSEEACNGLLPFWYRDDEGLAVASSPSTTSWGYGYNDYRTVDYTEEFDNKPTAAQLKALADSRVGGMPALNQSLSVSFLSLYQLKEYALISVLEKVALGDTVTVNYYLWDKDGVEKVNINTKTRVVKTVFNTLSEQYKSLELGTLKTTVADILLKEGK